MKKNIVGAIVGNDEPEALILHYLLDCTEHGTLHRMLKPAPLSLSLQRSMKRWRKRKRFHARYRRFLYCTKSDRIACGTYRLREGRHELSIHRMHGKVTIAESADTQGNRANLHYH